MRSYDQNIFTEWHSRYGGPGILIYWHVERRGLAWAFEQAMGAAWYYAASHPIMSTWARRTLRRILAANENE